MTPKPPTPFEESIAAVHAGDGLAALTPPASPEQIARKAALAVHNHKSEADLRYWCSIPDQDRVDTTRAIILRAAADITLTALTAATAPLQERVTELEAQLKDSSMRGCDLALKAYTLDLADIKAERDQLRAALDRHANANDQLVIERDQLLAAIAKIKLTCAEAWDDIHNLNAELAAAKADTARNGGTK